MGLADTMMSRDQTWLFFTLGRCLERTDVVARQLATVAFDDVYESGLVILLRSCGGYEPYLRLSQGVVEPGRVLDFLLRDRLFPRSAFASLTVAEDCLDQINAGRDDAWDDARGLVGLARAELEYSAPATLSPRPRDPPRAVAGLDLCGQRRGHAPLLRPGPAGSVAPRRRRRVSRGRAMAAAGVPRDPLRLRRPGAGLVQRAAAHAAHRAAARPRSRPESSPSRRRPSTPTSITGAPTSSPSTSTAATRASPSPARRSSIRSPPASPLDCSWSDVADAADDDGRPPLAQSLHRARGPTWSTIAADAARANARSQTARRIIEWTQGALRYVPRRDHRAHFGERGLRRRRRGLPGLRAPGPVIGQDGRPAVALRVGLLPS